MSGNHKQDSFDGGRAASLTTNPNAFERAPTDADDELALALAMLALSEGGDLGGVWQQGELSPIRSKPDAIPGALTKKR